jgi:hypothetical protein
MIKDDHNTIHIRVAIYWGLACVSKVEYPFDNGERVRGKFWKEFSCLVPNRIFTRLFFFLSS